MKVALLGADYEFADYKTSGTKFYRYMYYTSQAMLKKPEGLDIKIEAQKTNPTLGKGFSILFGSLLKDFSGYDVIHNFDLNPFFPLRKGKAAIVTTAHDLQFILAPQYNEDVNRNVKEKIYSSVITNLSLKSTLDSDYIISVSTLTKEDLIKLGYDKDKIYVVNHGIDPTFFRKIMPKNKEKKRKFVVGYLGALRTRKNPRFLIGAFRELKGDDYSMEIWGKLGFERDMILSLAKGDKRIHFNGFAPDDTFVDIYDSFDVFLLPTFYEGFAITILEAQARGVPVIIYKNGKIPKETRKYCIEAEDEEDAARIIQDLKENGYDEKRRIEAMKYVRTFTWEKTAENTIKVYKIAAGVA